MGPSMLPLESKDRVDSGGSSTSSVPGTTHDHRRRGHRAIPSRTPAVTTGALPTPRTLPHLIYDSSYSAPTLEEHLL